MKIRLLACFLLLTLRGPAQEAYYDKQEFVVSDFRIVPPSDFQDKARITLEMDMTLKHPFDDFEHSYHIFFRLYTAQGTLVYDGQSRATEIDSRPEYDQPEISLHTDLELIAAYTDIELPAGTHPLQVVISAYNANHMPFDSLLVKPVTITKPELYDYEDQEFSITLLKATSNIEKDEVKGIRLTFEYKPRFYSWQVKGVSSNRDLGYYYLEPVLVDQEKHDTVSYFFPDTEMQSATAEGAGAMTFHIPYHQLRLPAGPHQLLIGLRLCDRARIWTSYPPTTTICNMIQPQVYELTFALDSLEMGYNSGYDVGVWASYSKKNKGRGYPDLIWNLDVGQYTRYRSAKHKNSFTVSPATATAYLTDSDPLYLRLYDYDAIGRNDLITALKIAHPPGAFKRATGNAPEDPLEKFGYHISKREWDK